MIRLVPTLRPEGEVRPLRLMWPVVSDDSKFEYYLDSTGKLYVIIQYPCGRSTWWKPEEE